MAASFATPLAARHAIADQLAMPLGRLLEPDRAFIDALLSETLDRQVVTTRVRERFKARTGSR